ncbi:helix-turn-helix domain-containing protein [Sporolactobacillus spathodeae]|uniref:Uncharacterized protein YpbB n=1 Tax=Sporolactobacillus spathodeae TaxID=1465502 RepID=A0ABS2Q7S5_9BACL|nr:uncharacterized protein YpbB [Sporolactobacillus spathodeae]
MSYSLFLLLHMIRQFKGERTLSGIYHVLRGKQSAQPVQDSYLFAVRPFFHTLAGLSREEFNRLTNKLEEKGWIESCSKDQAQFRLTAIGEKSYLLGKEHYAFPKGLRYTEAIHGERLFWLRVQLLVQTLSGLLHQDSAFLTVTRDPSATEKVRGYLIEQTEPIASIARRVKTQLAAVWQLMDQQAADLLAGQLTGSGISGRTLEQFAVQFNLESIEVHLAAKSALRTMIHLIVQQPELAPDLRNLLDENEDNLTRSAQETRQLMKTGRSIEQLASIRRLAISTIQDHLVEMALKIRHFDCSPYVSQEQEHRIREIVRRLKTRQLKPLKARLGEQATYFQIRLILAKTSMEERGEITNV